jgi:hypothetical protein
MVGSDLRADRANGKAQALRDVCAQRAARIAQRAASRFNFALPLASVRPEVGPCLAVRPEVGPYLAVRPEVGPYLAVRPEVGPYLGLRAFYLPVFGISLTA